VPRRFFLLLAGVVGSGTALALVLAAVTDGDPYDMQSLRLVHGVLHADFLGLYEHHAVANRWPYPPGFLPWVSASGWLADATGISFEFIVRLASILANAAIALVVQDFLGRQGAGARSRLIAAGLVCLGPAFLVISGYHGQIDAVAILPAVLALHRWQYAPAGRRALEAGLLVGLGGAMKSVPLLMVVALAPSARSRRELATLLGAAAVPLVVAFLPFAVAGALPDLQRLAYRGIPGAGGLSLVVQPELPQAYLGIRGLSPSGLTRALTEQGSLVVAASLLAVGYVGAKTRAAAPQLAVLLWLVVFAFGVNFFFQYALWGLPFLLMAGLLRVVAVAQAVLALAMAIFYLRPWDEPAIGWAYSVLMLGLWAAVAVGSAAVAVRLLRGGRVRGDLTRAGRDSAATS